MTLRLTTQEAFDPAVSLTVTAETIAPTELQRELFQPTRHDLADALVDALRQLTEDQSPGEFRTMLTDDCQVTALDGAYAHLASQAVMAEALALRLIEVTRHLGGQTSLDIRSSLEDIRDGPVAVFAAAPLTPTVVLELDESFFACKSTQRTRFLRHLPRLSPGFDLRVTGSRCVLRKLVERHGDVLPASVTEDAQSRLSATTPSTTTDQTARAAEDALSELGVEYPGWGLAASLARTPAERRSYPDLYADEAFDVSDAGIRQRLKRLRDAGIVESVTINGTTHASLTPVGAVAIQKHPHITEDVNERSPSATATAASPTSRRAAWSTEHTSQTESPDGSPTGPSVSDPRNSRSSTVLSQPAHEGGVDAPPDVDGDAGSPSLQPTSSSPTTRFLSLSTHHATAAAASAGHFALVERPPASQNPDRDHREGRWSFDENRDEVVVSVDWSPKVALTATRLCAALLSDHAFDQVLTRERLAGQPDGMSLSGLAVQNPYVLRGAVCIGWLRNVDAQANRLRKRLELARRKLLAMTNDLYSDDGSLDEDTASEILKKAHGLMGTVLRVYDLLGVDVVREIRFPNGVSADDREQEALQEFLAVASSIGSRYGAYSGYRVLHEDRDEKRDDLISEPDIDRADPHGTLMGSWVLTGEGVSQLESGLANCSKHLSLQDDKQKFAPFRVDGAVVDGNRRQAVGEAVTRILSFKDGLRPDRKAISVLAALSSDVFAAADAVSNLGSEEHTRALDMQDIRYGLSQLSSRAILPDLGGEVVSDVVAALLDAQEPLSTAELAEAAGCSSRSLSTAANDRIFAELEAAGLLERENLGDGKSTQWRLQLTFRAERQDDEPLPRMLVGQKTSPAGFGWELSSAMLEVFSTAADEYGALYEFEFDDGSFFAATVGPPSERDLSGFLSEYTLYTPSVELLATLLAQEERLSPGEQIAFGTLPDHQQVSLATAAW